MAQEHKVTVTCLILGKPCDFLLWHPHSTTG